MPETKIPDGFESCSYEDAMQAHPEFPERLGWMPEHGFAFMDNDIADANRIWLRPAGLQIYCGKCGTLITEPGALRLHIGIPDSKGNFTGRKEHLCTACDWPERRSLHHDPLEEMRDVITQALDDINAGGIRNIRQGWSISAATALQNAKRAT